MSKRLWIGITMLAGAAICAAMFVRSRSDNVQSRLEQDSLDDALEDSFPASDPISTFSV